MSNETTNELARVEVPGQYAVTLRKTGRTYAVQYGLQETQHLAWHKAASEFGNCVFHALECAGLINRTR